MFWFVVLLACCFLVLLTMFSACSSVVSGCCLKFLGVMVIESSVGMVSVGISFMSTSSMLL